jgi:hypothetical protein
MHEYRDSQRQGQVPDAFGDAPAAARQRAEVFRTDLAAVRCDGLDELGAQAQHPQGLVNRAALAHLCRRVGLVARELVHPPVGAFARDPEFAGQPVGRFARGLQVLRWRQIAPVQPRRRRQGLQGQRRDDGQRLPVLPRRAPQQRGPGIDSGIGHSDGAVFLQARERLALGVVARGFQRFLPVGVRGQQLQDQRGAGLVPRRVRRQQLAQHEQRPAARLLDEGVLAVDLLDLGHEEANDRRIVDGQQVGHRFLVRGRLEEQFRRRDAVHVEHAQPRGARGVEAGAVAAKEVEAVAEAAFVAEQAAAVAAGPVVELRERLAHALGPPHGAIGLRVQTFFLRLATARHAISLD